MFIVFSDRPSDSPYIERVWSSHSERADTFRSIAACHWEMVVSRYHGKTFLTLRGPETKATTADCPAEGEWFGIRFKLGTFMPMMRPGELRNRNDVNMPSVNQRSFLLAGAAWEFPGFENAETFVSRLVRAGLVAMDPAVRGALSDQPLELHTRSVQRRFQQATGVSHSTVRQIERARKAALLLKQGQSILDAVDQTGYYDQAHMTRALKCLIGQTPEKIRRGEEQLSFLYNTDSI